MDGEGDGLHHVGHVPYGFSFAALGRDQHRRHQLWHDSEAFRQGSSDGYRFLVLYLGKFLCKLLDAYPFWNAPAHLPQIFTGYLVPFFYIPSYAQISLGTSRALALYSVVIAQGASIVGRMIFATLALHVGVMIPWVMCVSVSAILCYAWIGIKTKAAFCAFCALYGEYPRRYWLGRKDDSTDDFEKDSSRVPSSLFHQVFSQSSVLTRKSLELGWEWPNRLVP